MSAKTLAKFSPGRIILLSVIGTIIAGTLLLALPISRTQEIPLADLFFTATSATCVTGLMTIPLDHFTTFGQMIILVLLQIGGLGLITLTLFLFSLFVDLGLATQFMAVQLLEIESWKNIRRFIFFIIGLTLSIELIGAFFIFHCIKGDHSFARTCFLATFHAVSSFCNGGISLFGNSLVPYSHNYPLLIITIILMLAGGLGFVTFHEFAHFFNSFRTKRRHPFSLQTKIIVYATPLLIAGTTALLLFLERYNSFATMDSCTALLNTLFTAVSARGCGFLTVDVTQFHPASLLVFMATSFIGASPGSTASGIKITTLAIFIATIKSAIHRRNEVDIRGRRITMDQVFKTNAIISLSITWIIMSTFLLLITESAQPFLAVLLEAVSSFVTLGIDLGITSNLTPLGKLIIGINMIVGRIGSVTLIMALRRKSEKTEFSYPEERVMLS